MPDLVTKHFAIHNAIQFVESFSEAVPDIYYLFAGKSYSFTDDLNPPTPIDSYDEVYYQTWKDIIALKRIYSSDVSHIVPRYDWANNTLYAEYDCANANLVNQMFYVLTDENNVYKCIDNNWNANSVIKPTGTSPAITSTADGYRWKYMYTLSPGQISKFLTYDWLPVKTLTANDASAQWNTQSTAANGAIHHVQITSNGTGYLLTTNTFTAINTTTEVVLANNASETDGTYTGYSLFVSAGLGATQLRKIINYVGVSRTATLNTAFVATPNTSSRYVVSPSINILGDSGSSVAIRATAYISNVYNGQIKQVTMINSGFGYSDANTIITGNTQHGSGAAITPIISPLGGHGSDAVDELFGKNVMISISLSGNTIVEGNTLPSNNDIRTIGILKNPLLNSGLSANATNIDQTYRLSVSSVSGDFTADEIIVGETSGAKGRLVYFANTDSTRLIGTVKLIRVTTNGIGQSFRDPEVIRGLTSNVTALVSTSIRPACKPYSGLIIYTENRIPYLRASDQQENIKFILRF